MFDRAICKPCATPAFRGIDGPKPVQLSPPRPPRRLRYRSNSCHLAVARTARVHTHVEVVRRGARARCDRAGRRIRSRACGSRACPRGSAPSGSRAGSARRACIVIEGPRRPRALARLARRAPVLVIRADQLVHTPLVAPLIEACARRGGRARSPSDLTVGPMRARSSPSARPRAPRSRRSRAAIATTSDRAAADATKIPHGAIARAPIATPDERRAAHRLLYRDPRSSRRTTRSRATCTGRSRSR